MKRTVIIIVYILITLGINSCTVDNKIPLWNGGTDDNDICILPVAEFAYPTGFGEPIITEKEHIMPRPPWDAQIKIYEDSEIIQASLKSFVIRHRDGYVDQIWMSYGIYPGLEFVAQYDLNLKKIKTYESVDQPYLPRFIYASSSGELWGVSYKDEILQTPFLVRFNDLNEKFEPMSANKIYLEGDITAITKDKKGLYWISLLKRDMQTGTKKYTFFSFNVITTKLIEYPNVSVLSPSSLAIAPDNRVWMVIQQDGRQQLAVFDPYTEMISVHKSNTRIADGIVLEDLDSLTNLYFDRDGRLWLDDRGWLEFSSTKTPEWYRIIRSPVFIEKQIYSEKRYIWRRPYFMSQSSNGTYWFGSPNGTVSLEPSNGKWCWFTTYISNIIEDQDNGLWMIADGNLYKYQLEP